MSRNVGHRVPVFSLGERVRKAREDLRLSQIEFGRRVFKSKDTIGNWEAGRTTPTYADLMLVSSVADVSLEWLSTGYGGPGDPDSPPDHDGDTPQSLTAGRYRFSRNVTADSPSVAQAA